MPNLEPPIPSAAADAFVASTPDRPGSPASARGSVKRRARWRRTIGLLLLAIVVFLWTATNFLASALLADRSFGKPYFMTYFNTSFFILPLIPALIHKAYRHPEELQDWIYECKWWIQTRFSSGLRLSRRQETLLDGHAAPAQRESAESSRELLLGEALQMDSSGTLTARSYTSKTDHTVQLSIIETAKLGAEFCILWFLANYFVVACLKYTTVASSTILTSTSSIFTLILGAFFGVEPFTVRKLAGVLASLAGIILVSTVDFSGKSSDDEHRGDFPEKSMRDLAIGNTLALLSAIVYGIYTVFMKKRIADENVVNMPIFMGFVGLTNVLCLWPGFFILHWTGLETFVLPSSGRVTMILIANATGSMVSDIAWAFAVLLTSPILVTVGLSLTIPLSLVGQMVLNSQTSSGLYWLGACIVVLSFVIINHEEKKEELARQLDEGDSTDSEQRIFRD